MRKEVVRQPDLFLPHPEPSSGDGKRNGGSGQDGLERMNTSPHPTQSLYYLTNCWGNGHSLSNSQRRFTGAGCKSSFQDPLHSGNPTPISGAAQTLRHPELWHWSRGGKGQKRAVPGLQASLGSRTVGVRTGRLYPYLPQLPSALVPALPFLSLLFGCCDEQSGLWAPSIWVTGDCHKYFLFPAWKKEAQRAGSALGPAPYHLGGGVGGYFDILWSSENPARELFFRAFVSWNATVPSVPPPPPARRATSPATPGRTWFPLLGVPRHSFICLFACFYTLSGLFRAPSLEIKEPKAAILAEAVSVPLPEACTALIGTTDLCSFVRVILPFCVNYSLPALHLSPPQSDYF